MIAKYFLGFPHHFHLFDGVAVIQKIGDLWQDVEGDLLRVNFRFDGLAIQQLGGLADKLLDALFAGTGNRLVGANIDPGDADGIINGFLGY